jgi:hypothetical protein
LHSIPDGFARLDPGIKALPAHDAPTPFCHGNPIFTTEKERAFNQNATDVVVFAGARYRLPIVLDLITHFVNRSRTVFLPEGFPRKADRKD